MFPDLPGRIVVHVGQILLHPAARIQLRLQRQPTAAATAAVHRTKHRHLPIKDDSLVVVVALQRHAALSTSLSLSTESISYISVYRCVSAVSLGLYSYGTHKYSTPTPLVYPILF